MARNQQVDQAYLAAEAKARVEIDKQLLACGWLVQDRAALNLYVGGYPPGSAPRRWSIGTSPSRDTR